MTIESNSIDAFDVIEADTARWRAFLEENWGDLVKGVPKRPDGWWKEGPECPVCWMFEMFPLARLN
jgi:hypothetical protein